jgi:hypothetical protein
MNRTARGAAFALGFDVSGGTSTAFWQVLNPRFLSVKPATRLTGIPSESSAFEPLLGGATLRLQVLASFNEDMVCDGVPGVMNPHEEQQERGRSDGKKCGAKM